jgi:PAS domain S-box-containing protein
LQPDFIQAPSTHSASGRLLAQLAAPLLAGELFDLVPDTVFFLKDRAGRYLAVNQTLAERCGRRGKAEIIGQTVRALFPAELAAIYAAQDEEVLSTGRPIVNKLELHLYANGSTGWCLTTKLPLRDSAGKVMGLAGLSRDLPTAGQSMPATLVETVEFLREHYAEPMSTALLARRARLTPARLTRLVKRLFQLTPGQLILQTRLQAAAQRLRDGRDSVAMIAVECGFYDHSSFSRHFKAATGLTPLAYRAAARG